MPNFPNHIILFDGICNLCNGAVKFIVKRDKKKIFRFASLQSETGRYLLEKYGLSTTELDTFVYVRNGRHYVRAEAGLLVLKDLGGMWELLGKMNFLPASVKNFLYQLIAKNRYRIFGKMVQCTIMEIDFDERILK